LYSLGASKTKLHAYQFIPLLKFLDSPYRRILIADEVGLGKTIEAGYVLLETLARERWPRILIACPASLRSKWQIELSERFNVEFDILALSDAMRCIPLTDEERRRGRPLRGIVSLQSIRNTRFMERLNSADAPIDLLIVDEAHHCRNPTAKQSQVVADLVSQAEAAVFLSATPIQTSEDNLFQLLHILVPEEFVTLDGYRERLAANGPLVRAEGVLRKSGRGALAEVQQLLREIPGDGEGAAIRADPLFAELTSTVNRCLECGDDSAASRVQIQGLCQSINLLGSIFTRTKRRDVHVGAALRQAVVPDAELSPYEQEVYDALTQSIFHFYAEQHGDAAAEFVATSYRQQVASSLPASVRRYREDLAFRRGAPDSCIRGEEDVEDGEDDPKPLLLDYAPFREVVQHSDVERLEREDSKYLTLVRSLKAQRELVLEGARRSRKAIVFAYYKRSLHYLERRLESDGFRVLRIDGDVPSTPTNPESDERGRRIHKFRHDEGVDVLLTSEVGSEGLDFQFCDTVFNWDLPWNPMRVEQRIGRVDRIGQRSERIFIFNLASRGTIEHRILNRLYDRVGIFEDSIGELEPILGEIVRRLEKQLFQPGLTTDEQDGVIMAEAIAIETQRQQQGVLEGRCDELIGHDQFFLDKYRDVRRQGRYVSGEALYRFVTHELAAAVPGIGFQVTPDDGVYVLPHDRRIGEFMTRFLGNNQPDVHAFESRMRGGAKGVRFAFDGSVADQFDDVEVLHARHPLVASLVKRLDGGQGMGKVAAAAMCESTAVSSGLWLLGWGTLNETGYLNGRMLRAVALPLEDGLSEVTPEQAEELLADVVRAGTASEIEGGLSLADSSDCVQRLDLAMLVVVEARRAERARRFQGLVGRRRRALDATYLSRIRRQEELLDRMKARGDDGAKRILPAMANKLERMREDHAQKVDEVNALELGTVHYALDGVAVVEVVPG